MKKSLIILLLFFTALANATNYYVKNSGSDAAAGTSDETAWATMAKVISAISPGDSVFFERGGVWREQLIPLTGASGAHTYYGAYGEGAKPKILGSVEKNEESDWTNVSGNIWTTANGSFTTDIGNLIFDGEDACGVKIMDATPTLDAQGEFWYDFTNDLIQVYSVGNPATFYRDIECAITQNVIYHTDKDYVTYQNLDVRYGGRHGMGTSIGANYVNVFDCDFSYIGGGDQLGTYTTRLGNGVEFWGASHDCYVERCRFDQIYDAAITPQGDVGTYAVYNHYYKNNVISRSEYSYEVFWHDANTTATDIYFENNTCVDAGGGFGHDQRPSPRGTHVRLGGIDATCTRVMVRNNIFYEATDASVMYHVAAHLAKVTFDYNDYYQSDGKALAYRDEETATYYYTLANWQTISGQEANAIDDDPLITQTDYFDFVYFSDIHVDYASWDPGELDAFAAGINIKNPSFTVSLGDNVDVAATVNRDLYNSTMSVLDSSLYTFRGNHDNGWWDTHGVIDYENIRVVFFYASYYALPEPPSYNNTGHVTSAELLWLETQLREAEGRDIILIGHYPLEESIWGHIIDGHGRAEIIALMNKYDVKIYLSGHNHGGNQIFLVADYGQNIDSYAAASLRFITVRAYRDRLTITPYIASSPYNATTPVQTIQFRRDYHLAETSPAIGVGLDIDLAADFDGVSRGDTPSIGAYEYSESGTPPPPSPPSLGEGPLGVDKNGTCLIDKNGRIIIIQ